MAGRSSSNAKLRSYSDCSVFVELPSRTDTMQTRVAGCTCCGKTHTELPSKCLLRGESGLIISTCFFGRIHNLATTMHQEPG